MNKKQQKLQLDEAIVRALIDDSDKTYRELTRHFGVSINYITNLVQQHKLFRKRGAGSPAWKRKHNE